MRTFRVLALPVLLCMLGAACAGPAGLQARTGVGAASLPPLIVTDGSEVKFVAQGSVEVIGAVDGIAGVAFSDGPDAVIVERKVPVAGGEPEPVALVHLERGGNSAPIETRTAANVFLYDVETVEGVSYLLYGTFEDEVEPEGELVLRNLGTARETTVAQAFMIEFSTSQASIGGRVIVASAYSDLTEHFGFYALDATPLPDRPNPTDDLPYNMPPLLVHAVLSPDGSRLAYLEGPDWDGQRQVTVGTWKLVVIDQGDGAELLRLDLFGQDRQASWLDFDGRWAAVSSMAQDGTALPPLLVDTQAPNPTTTEVPAATGTATLAAAG